MATADYTLHSGIARHAFHSAIIQDLVPLDPSFKGLPWLGIEGQALKIPRIAWDEATQFLTVAQSIFSAEDYADQARHFRDQYNFGVDSFR